MDNKKIKNSIERQINLSLELSVHVLKDLVSQGYLGDELINKFKIQSKNINDVIITMLNETYSTTLGDTPAASFDDIFNIDK